MSEFSAAEIKNLSDPELVNLIRSTRNKVEHLRWGSEDFHKTNSEAKRNFNKLIKEWAFGDSDDAESVRRAYRDMCRIKKEMKEWDKALESTHKYRLRLSDELAERVQSERVSL